MHLSLLTARRMRGRGRGQLSNPDARKVFLCQVFYLRTRDSRLQMFLFVTLVCLCFLCRIFFQIFRLLILTLFRRRLFTPDILRIISCKSIAFAQGVQKTAKHNIDCQQRQKKKTQNDEHLTKQTASATGKIRDFDWLACNGKRDSI